MKWTELYDTEQDLIDDMLKTYTDPKGIYWKLCKGYEFLNGFKAYYAKYGHLTDRQLTQLKRLAPEIHRNVHETLKGV